MPAKDIALSAFLGVLGAGDLLLLDAGAVPALLHREEAVRDLAAVETLPLTAIAAEPPERGADREPPGPLAVADALPPAAPPDSGLSEALLVVHFETGSTRLSSQVVSQIEALAEARPTAQFSVSGHTDARGAGGYNAELSLARARAVADVLLRRGVPASHVQTRGFGSSQPLDHGTSTAAHDRNRRAEVALVRGTP
jgi:outer membrane protein OmpA-like peptidoglycan-associated protein